MAIRDSGGLSRTRVAPVSVGLSTLLTVCLATSASAQSDLRNEPTIGNVPTILHPVDVLSAAGAAVVYIVPMILIDPDPVSCVPCDRTAVPFFDRWAIAPERPGVGTASDLLRAGIAAFSWLDLADEGPQGRAGIVASIESFMWAESVAQLLKRVVGRNRPVLYTEAGVPVAGLDQKQRSWPSGHAATAAALAVSYWLTRNRISSGGKKDARRWILLAGAVGCAALRVAAAKHFPSDVVAGLAIGTASAVVVHSIKF